MIQVRNLVTSTSAAKVNLLELHKTQDPPSPGVHVPRKNLDLPWSPWEGLTFQATRQPTLPVPGGSSLAPSSQQKLCYSISPAGCLQQNIRLLTYHPINSGSSQGANSVSGAGRSEVELSQSLTLREQPCGSVFQEPRGAEPTWTIQGKQNFHGR